MTRLILTARLISTALILAVSVNAQGSARVVYTKVFPGSDPAYVSIVVERTGTVAYKETPTDDPDMFQLEDQTAAAIFDLSDKLDHFKRPLESGLKVANMGAKTFRWENGTDSSESKFNFSVDPNAQALQEWFERISESERALATLSLAVKHDKLGVQDAMLRIQSLWDQKRLVGTGQFLPLFDRLIKDESYLHMARERAATLAAAIRSGK